MAPETYFVSISPLFSDPFKPTNGVQSNQTYVQILGKFAHRSPSNFEIFDQCHLWLLGSYTSHMALGSVLLYRMPSKRECHDGHDAYPHRTCCVSTSQPQDTLNTGMYLDLGKSTVSDISLCKNYGYVSMWGRTKG